MNLIVSDTTIFVYEFTTLYIPPSGVHLKSFKASKNPLASYSLINFEFLLPHTAHLDAVKNTFCIFSTLQTIK